MSKREIADEQDARACLDWARVEGQSAASIAPRSNSRTSSRLKTAGNLSDGLHIRDGGTRSISSGPTFDTLSCSSSWR